MGGGVTPKVFYNSAPWNKAPEWRDLSAGTPLSSVTDPVCCFERGMCYIWLTHFCEFVIAVDRRGDRHEYTSLVAYAEARYNAHDRLLQVDAGVTKSCELVSLTMPVSAVHGLHNS